MEPTIRPETDADFDAIGDVHRRAFGGVAEAELVDVLRADGYARLSLVAHFEQGVVGHILFSDLRIVTTGRTVPALALAPMAVVPEHQRAGIGSALVRRGLEICRDRGHRIVVVVGHPTYYPRFGFSAELAGRLESRYSGPSHMAMELAPGALGATGARVEYPPPFARF